MRYVLGIDIGGTHAYAAISRFQDGLWTRPELLRLGREVPAIPSALHAQANGLLTVVDLHRQPDIDPVRVARGFSRRIGDEVPIVLGGEPFRPDVLTATLTQWIVDQALHQEGLAPERIVVSHPGSWGPYRRGLLHRALWEAGLGTVTLLPEPVATAESHTASGHAPLASADPLAVYALGSTHFEVSVVRRAASHPGFELIGAYEPAESIGGADLDDVLVAHLRARLGRELEELPTDDPRRRILGELRAECARAKEALSVAPATEVRIPLPRRVARIPVTREEWETLIRPTLVSTVDALLHVISACRVRPAEIHRVLLTGGATQIPLVADLLEAQFPGRVAVDPDPRVTTAIGAALAGCRIAAETTPPEQRRHSAPAAAPLARALTEPSLAGPSLADPANSAPSRASASRAAASRAEPAEPRRDAHRDEPIPSPPPRPPVNVTPLTLPRPKSRLQSARGTPNPRPADRPRRLTWSR